MGKLIPPAAEDAAHIKLLTYQRQEIVHLDYKDLNREQCWELTRAFDRWVRLQAPGSVRVLFEIDRVSYEASHINHWKSHLDEYETWITHSAFAGKNPFFRMLVPTLRTFAAFTGARFNKNRGRIFLEKNEALDFLAK